MLTWSKWPRRRTASWAPIWLLSALRLLFSAFVRRWMSSISRMKPSTPRFWTLWRSPTTTSALPWALPTLPLFARPRWRCRTCRGPTLVVWRRSSASCKRLSSTLLCTQRSSSDSAWRRRAVCFSSVPQDAARPFWPRPLQTSASPTSFPSRAQSCSPCGLASLRQMCAKSSTRLVVPPLVSSSLTSWIPLLAPVAAVVATLVALATAS
mmetsp:Transcript_17788/g.41871  ORF Transcript_17788/g.41871 Transcript_17788/m.41871 type:complete len:209 (-) Transcript_17788:706-1332(-)